jgi:hypothetical protein
MRALLSIGIPKNGGIPKHGGVGEEAMETRASPILTIVRKDWAQIF